MKAAHKIAARTIERLMIPLGMAEEMDLALDGSGELGGVIADHYEIYREDLEEEIADLFNITVDQIHAYREVAQAKEIWKSPHFNF